MARPRNLGMKVIFLGTNGWYDTQVANTTCVLVETEQNYLILDAGFGFHKVDRYIRSHKPIRLFLSHLHLDHIIGLHVLPKFRFAQGIDIYVPHGMKKFLMSFMSKPYTKPLEELPTKIMIYELGKDAAPDSDFKFRKLRHPVLCYGYRFGLEGKTVAYCTDTGVCKAIYALAKDADLLISECSFKSGGIIRNAIHLNPYAAARIARLSKAKRLALIHFDATLYTSLKDRDEAEGKAKKIFKDTVAAQDDEEINL
jgi:ribonuclease BN (tRNA processing enzyme)